MCRLDLKDAYLLVPIDPGDKKFLRFEYCNKLYQFKALPFGLSSASCVFIKIGKQIVNWLRKKGVKVVIYLDDFLIFGNSYKTCLNDTKLTRKLVIFLGFLINAEKSDLVPKKQCKFLVMIIDSKNMTVELPSEKLEKIKNLIDISISNNEIKFLEACRIYRHSRCGMSRDCLWLVVLQRIGEN